MSVSALLFTFYVPIVVATLLMFRAINRSATKDGKFPKPFKKREALASVALVYLMSGFVQLGWVWLAGARPSIVDFLLFGLFWPIFVPLWAVTAYDVIKLYVPWLIALTAGWVFLKLLAKQRITDYQKRFDP